MDFGGQSIRLRAPDDVKLATLYGDSKLLMDLLVRSGGITLRRPISALFMVATGMVRQPVLHQLEMMTNYLWITYEGSPGRWREFLPLKPYQPKMFSKITVDIRP